MRIATSSGVCIAYDSSGQGEPALLFLPGWCSDRSAFSDLLPRLSVHRRAMALDWRGHGESAVPGKDFGATELLEDVLAVIRESDTEFVIPVALSHAGWVALELRRRLGERIPGIVLIDWLVQGAPPQFLEALGGMQSQEHWRQTVDAVFEHWLHGVENDALSRFVRRGMGKYGFEMWSRAAREISAAYMRESSPLEALARLASPPPVLHLCAQPDDPAYLAAQGEFSAKHPWFRVRKLDARSHFPMFEIPDAIADEIERFASTCA